MLPADQSSAFLDKARGFLAAGGTAGSADFADIVAPHLARTLLLKLQLTDGERQFLQASLPQLLIFVAADMSKSVVITPVLGGLYAAGCWTACIDNDLRAYSLASALIAYAGSYSEGSALDDAPVDGVRDILNTWLRPATPWTSMPSSSVVARHMFGDAWCDLFLPSRSGVLTLRGHDHEDGHFPQYVAIERVLVLSGKPPFLPGLCTFDRTETITLPTDLSRP